VEGQEPMLDVIYIILGVGVLGLFAAYAASLRNI
jgi:hypothetical protein